MIGFDRFCQLAALPFIFIVNATHFRNRLLYLPPFEKYYFFEKKEYQE